MRSLAVAWTAALPAGLLNIHSPAVGNSPCRAWGFHFSWAMPRMGHARSKHSYPQGAFDSRYLISFFSRLEILCLAM